LNYYFSDIDFFHSSANSFNPMETSLPDTEKMNMQVPPLDLDFRTHSFSNEIRHSGIELQHIEGESKLSSPKHVSEGSIVLSENIIDIKYFMLDVTYLS